MWLLLTHTAFPLPRFGVNIHAFNKKSLMRLLAHLLTIREGAYQGR